MEELVQKYHPALSFCLMMWLNFAFTGETVVNCKLFRAYSLLRTELQNVMIKAHQQLTYDLPMSSSMSSIDGARQSAKDTQFSTVTFSFCDFQLSSQSFLYSNYSVSCFETSEDKKGKKGAKDQADGSISALRLAEILCKTFSGAAAECVAAEDDDDEDAALNRIMTVVRSKQQEIMQPLKQFMQECINLPLTLHAAPRDAMADLASLGKLRTGHGKAASSTNIRDLTHVMSLIKGTIEGALPFTWLAFGMDVVEIFNSRGYFPQGTEEAGYLFCSKTIK